MGKYNNPNGDFYEGQFKNMFHGKGNYFYVDGSFFEAELRKPKKRIWNFYNS